MSLLSNFMHPGKAYGKAKKASEPYYQQAMQFQLPAFQQGQNAYQSLIEQLGGLLNPAELESKFLSTYEESPSAKMAEEMAKQRGLDALSASGMLGSTPGLNALQTGATNIALADRQKYLDDLMQKYLTGLGIAGNIYNAGNTAGANLGATSMQRGSDVGNLSFNEANAGGDLFGKLLGTGAGLIGNALGGPIGGAMAKGLTQKMGWSTVGGE